VLNTRLTGREFIAGDYSIADIACWPWILFRAHHGVELDDYPELRRWFRAIEGRAAVRRAIGDFVTPAPPQFDAQSRAVLFGDRQR
jgi:GST-like protein